MMHDTTEEVWDVLVTGAGPAGAACALAGARAGLRVAVVERAHFPRHKVCGDCLNPDVWPVLDRLGAGAAIRALPHAELERVRFVRRGGKSVEVPLPAGAERAVRREAMDAALLETAREAGAVLFAGHAVTAVQRDPQGWAVTAGGRFLTRCVVAADGRNSTTCRLLGLAPRAKSARLAVQTHAPLTDALRGTVALEIHASGYCGLAPVDGDSMNICLVSNAAGLEQARAAVQARFGLGPDHAWHSIAPLERADVSPAPLPGVFLAGDAARVVEPFTGEGIYYALATGELAAAAAGRHLEGREGGEFLRAHAALYHRRLWVNRLTRLAVTRPWLGEALLAAGAVLPGLLRLLTRKIVRNREPATAPQPR